MSTLITTSAMAQSEQQGGNTEGNPATGVPFYKWEIGLDALPLIGKSKDAFGYILKRNFQKENGRQALRFKLLPELLKGPGTGSGATERQSSIAIAIGYERQRLMGHFSVLYGGESFVSHQLVKIQSSLSASPVLHQKHTTIGVNGFIGGRYYLSNHLALTLESHLIYQYNNSKGNVANTGSYFFRTNHLFVEPIHAFYISYHF